MFLKLKISLKCIQLPDGNYLKNLNMIQHQTLPRLIIVTRISSGPEDIARYRYFHGFYVSGDN